MAKVTGPLFSTTARGQIGKSLIYSSWHGIKYVKKYAVPTNPNTPAQQAVRQKFLELISRWKEIEHLADGKSPQWENARMLSDYYGTAFNLFLSNYLPSKYPDALFTHHLEVSVTFIDSMVQVQCTAYFVDFNSPDGRTVIFNLGEYPTGISSQSFPSISFDGDNYVASFTFMVTLELYNECNAFWVSSTPTSDFFILSGAFPLPPSP